MKIIKFLFLSALSLSLALSCKPDEPDTPPEPPKPADELSLSVTTSDFQSEGGSASVIVKTNVPTWTAEASASWCTTRVNGNTLIITASESEERGVRECTVNVKAASLTQTIAVRQLGYQGAVLLSENSFEVAATGGPVSFIVTTNVTLEAVVSNSWVTKPQTKAVPMKETEHLYQVIANKTSGKRSATITFTEPKPAGAAADFVPVTAVVNISQDFYEGYMPEPGDSIKDDTKLTVTNATASASEEGAGIGLAYDGDPATHWHSPWDNETPNYWPITATFELSQVENVDYLVYTPRNDDSSNGNFKEVSIEISTDGQNFTHLMDFDFEGNNAVSKVLFDAPARAKYFRFVIKSGAGARVGFASCAEMAFYKKDPGSFDWTTLFADEVCSKLKDGITQEQIDACEHPFFKNLANYMITNRYSTEFRVNTYKAYPRPSVQSKSLRIVGHSRMDNPTGMAVNQGDELIILVGKTHNRPLTLLIQNLDRPENNGYFWGSTHPLSQGVNKIQVPNNGLCYVLYHTSSVEEADAAAPIPIHFATGTVNGYYDNENPDHKGRWSDILAKTTNKYFDVLGKYAHITYEVADFRAHALQSGPELIEIYDRILGAQYDLMGLPFFNKPIRNRMYFNVMYHNMAYATENHIGFAKGIMENVCKPESALKSAWTIAHEAGHMNQTRKGMWWIGCSEVTNNVFSLYVQTQVSEQPSRINEPQFGTDWRNTYSRAFTQIQAEGRPHALCGDVFARLVPFWQLELYFGQVKGNTPALRSDKGGFYPELFEYCRQESVYEGMDNGQAQLEFVFAASKAAKTNLLDFFEKWGFLTPVDTLITDYGTERLLVTQAQVDQIRRRVEALGYPEPEQPIHYISDNTVELFKKREAIIESANPKHSIRVNDDIKVDDPETGYVVSHTVVGFHFREWKNVVAYEVYDPAGKLIFVNSANIDPNHNPESETPGHDFFKLHRKWESGMTVYAVSATGEKVEMPILYASDWVI